MHTAVTMNKQIKEHSSEAQLVILNLPKPPKSYREQSEMNCTFSLTIRIPFTETIFHLLFIGFLLFFIDKFAH